MRGIVVREIVMDSISSKDSPSKTAGRSQEYLEALVLLGGSPDDLGLSNDLISSDVGTPEVEVAPEEVVTGELAEPRARLAFHYQGDIACGGSLSQRDRRSAICDGQVSGAVGAGGGPAAAWSGVFCGGGPARPLPAE